MLLRRYYLAYAPRILRAGVDEKVLVTTYNVNFEVEVKASLRDDRNRQKVIATGVAKVQPGRFTYIASSLLLGSHKLFFVTVVISDCYCATLSISVIAKLFQRIERFTIELAFEHTNLNRHFKRLGVAFE